MFLIYTKVNVLFLPCKKVGFLVVNRNTITRNIPFCNILTANKLKISKKRDKDLKEKLTKA